MGESEESGAPATGPDQRPSTLRLKVLNDLGTMESLSHLIEGFCTAYELDQESKFALNVALDELVTNVISYAYPDGQPRFLDINLSMSGDQLTVEIEDDGVAFDPLAQEVPDTESELEERAIGGLGIEIVKNLMDEVTYERHEDRNILTMRRKVVCGA